MGEDSGTIKTWCLGRQPCPYCLTSGCRIPMAKNVAQPANSLATLPNGWRELERESNDAEGVRRFLSDYRPYPSVRVWRDEVTTTHHAVRWADLLAIREFAATPKGGAKE